MLLLVSGATRDVDTNPDPLLGKLFEPHGGNRNDGSRPWALDNGCFGGLDAERFQRALERNEGLPNHLFTVVPDVVADAQQTLDLWDEWRDRVQRPRALVLQDGQESLPIPWGELDAVFVGGSTEFKVGEPAARLVSQAIRRGKWVHWGRVNTARRIRHVAAVGGDSIDGSGFSKWPKRIPLGLRWIRQCERQPVLF